MTRFGQATGNPYMAQNRRRSLEELREEEPVTMSFLFGPESDANNDVNMAHGPSYSADVNVANSQANLTSGPSQTFGMADQSYLSDLAGINMHYHGHAGQSTANTYGGMSMASDFNGLNMSYPPVFGQPQQMVLPNHILGYVNVPPQNPAPSTFWGAFGESNGFASQATAHSFQQQSGALAHPQVAHDAIHEQHPAASNDFASQTTANSFQQQPGALAYPQDGRDTIHEQHPAASNDFASQTTVNSIQQQPGASAHLQDGHDTIQEQHPAAANGEGLRGQTKEVANAGNDSPAAISENGEGSSNVEGVFVEGPTQESDTPPVVFNRWGVQRPSKVNRKPNWIPGASVAEASLAKRGLRRTDRLSLKPNGASDPENLMIIHMFDVMKMTFGQIYKALNKRRIKAGGEPNFTKTSVHNRYNRNAPILYELEGREWIPLTQRKDFHRGVHLLVDKPTFKEEDEEMGCLSPATEEGESSQERSSLFTPPPDEAEASDVRTTVVELETSEGMETDEGFVMVASKTPTNNQRSAETRVVLDDSDNEEVNHFEQPKKMGSFKWSKDYDKILVDAHKKAASKVWPTVAEIFFEKTGKHIDPGWAAHRHQLL